MGSYITRHKRGIDGGFTMIELLLVVIIIIILALIAIPVFISQREKGWDANVKSDLHNAAIAQQTHFHDNDTFTNQVSDLLVVGYRNSSKITLTVDSADAGGFCMEAYHEARPGKVWYVDNGSGTPNPLEGTCP